MGRFTRLATTARGKVKGDRRSGQGPQAIGGAASAQDISGSFLALGDGAACGAVSSGTLTSTVIKDYYSFPLNSGDVVSLAQKATTAGGDSVSLLNASGAVLASGAAGATNVDFREDESRVRVGHGDENLAVMRRMALNLLKRDQSVKVGIHSKRLKAGRDDRYLLQLLTQGLDAI